MPTIHNCPVCKGTGNVSWDDGCAMIEDTCYMCGGRKTISLKTLEEWENQERANEAFGQLLQHC